MTEDPRSELESLILKYLDGECEAQEIDQLEKKLNESQEARKTYRELTRLEQSLKSRHRFSNKVILFPERESSEENVPLTTNNNEFIYRSLAALAMMSIIVIGLVSLNNTPNQKHSPSSIEPKGEAMVIASDGGRLASVGPIQEKPDLTTIKKIRYNQHIRPILSDKCFFCHGPDDKHREEGLRLDEREAAIKAGAIVPGKPEKSELITRIFTEDPDDIMPPQGKHKDLTANEKELLRRWIIAGATYEKHWAYSNITRNSEDSIDSLVETQLKENKLSFSKRADKRTLIRRLSLDIIGLPPTLSEINAFINDDSVNAYEKVVDRLLASKHYGEKMATFWFDAVRYANSNGYHGDVRWDASPFRDYVIRSFNNNLPFDQFTIEQIAGDLLPNASLNQRVAASYVSLGQFSHEGGIQDAEYLIKYRHERVRTTSTAWLGATLLCAECHNHKYDPYTTKDFYRFSAFFADVLEKGAWNGDGKFQEKPSKYLKNGYQFKTYAYSQWRDKNLALEIASDEELKIAKSFRDELKSLDDEKQNLDKSVSSKEVTERKRKLSEEIETIKKKLNTHEASFFYTPATISAKPRMVRILKRGNWMDKNGEVVTPATPHFLPGYIESTDQKRLSRLDLAKWIIDKDNPLTARTFTNRLWAQFFGNGISNVLFDLGLQGEWPSHPELLDLLSHDFQTSGWDVKKLIKQMVMSKTYQQSSHNNQKLKEYDPNNRLLARQNHFRLEAEFIRDNALAISGLLNPKMYGRSFFPYQPSGYYRHMNFPVRTYQESGLKNQHRRAVYMHWQRTFLHPMLKAFDAPPRDECVMKRPRSNTPVQSLVLLNDPTFVEAARVFAEELLANKQLNDSAKLSQAFERCVARKPDPAELKILHTLFKQQQLYFSKHTTKAKELIQVGLYPNKDGLNPIKLAAMISVTRSLLNTHETITRY